MVNILNNKGYLLLEILLALTIALMIFLSMTLLFNSSLGLYYNLIAEIGGVELEIISEKIATDIALSRDIILAEAEIRIKGHDGKWTSYLVYNSSYGKELGFRREKARDLNGEIIFTRVDSLLSNPESFELRQEESLYYLFISYRDPNDKLYLRERSIFRGG
ncbi:MAG: hypothetical protein ABR596_07695 [Halarsenatibacteraceae bacterium]